LFLSTHIAASTRFETPQNLMPALLLHDLPFEIVPLEARLLLCSTPAGFPSPAADDIEEPIDLGTWLIEQPAASYVMRVDGTSMAGAGINDGDLIVVSRAKKPRPGHIVVALVHGDRTLKRLKRAGDRLWLIAEAEGYGETIVDENVEIWGVVVGLARRY
jgi:DNA polymerase V